MKKTIAILLVAVLAAGSLFAGLSGEASVTAGVNLDTKEWGFLGNGTNVKFDLSLGKEDVENVAEGEVYASIKASVEAKLANNPYKGSSSVDVVKDGNYLPFSTFGVDIDFAGNKYTTTTTYNEVNGFMYPVRLRASISEAKIFGSNWYVSILGVPGAPDFAKSAIDTEEDKAAGSLDDWGFAIKDATSKAVSYKVAYDKAPGVEAGYADFVAGVGFNSKNSTESTSYTLYLKTPEYAVEGVTLQGALVSSKKADSKAFNHGASAKVGYATDVLSASIATDMGIKVEEKKDTAFDMDVAANFKYDFVTVDAYLNTAKTTAKADNAVALPLLLSAKVATDLNAFDVPVKLELTGKDLLAKIDLGAKVTVNAIENLELTVSGGYVVNTLGRNAEVMYDWKDKEEKPFAGQWSAKVGATYTAPIAKISGEISMKNWSAAEVVKLATDPVALEYIKEYEVPGLLIEKVSDINTLAKRLVLGAKVSVENTTLIPGATLKLAWEGKDLVNKVTKKVTKGTVAASCTIKF